MGLEMVDEYVLGDSSASVGVKARYGVEAGEPSIVGVRVRVNVKGCSVDGRVAGHIFVVLDEDVAGTDSVVASFGVIARSGDDCIGHNDVYVPISLPGWLGERAVEAVIDVFVSIEEASVDGIECSECALVRAYPETG